MDTHGNPLSDVERDTFFRANTLRLAVENGFHGRTFATADEMRVPGYDDAYRRGALARSLGRTTPPL